MSTEIGVLTFKTGGRDGSKIDQTLHDRLAENIEKQEDRILKLEASVFQLANYNFVFQGVILSAVITGSSRLKCLHFWLPLSLSVIGAILNFVTLLIISQKYNHYLDQLDIKTEIWYKEVYQSKDAAKRLRRKHRKQKLYRKLALFSSMVLFLAFSSIMAAAIKIIPCLYH